MDSSAAEQLKEFNIYDFDNTIYKGDSSIDFYLFCIRKQPSLMRYLPYQFWHFLLFAFQLENSTKFKSHFFIFLRGVGDVEKRVEQFWARHFKNIKDWYREADHSKDIIVSASPEFLLRFAANKLKTYMLIATLIDTETGLIDGKNCHGEEKVARLRQAFVDLKVGRTYTDSLSDMPILALAKERFIVRGDKIISLQEYAKMPRIKKISLPDVIDD